MRLLFSLLVLLGTMNLSAQNDVPHPFPMDENALLWKISGNNVEGNCYLFGTMHLIQKEYFLFPKKLQKIVKKSDNLVMEIAGIPSQTEAMGYILLKEGSFFDFFNPEQTDSILTWAKDKFGMEEPVFRAAFSKMKPFTVVQMGTQLYFAGKTESYELSFEKIAKENDIHIIGLETVEEQMSLFDNLTPKQQADMVMEGIRDGDKGIEFIQEMQQVYIDQNVDSLYSMITQEGGVISKEQKKFLDDRNGNWVPMIKKYITENNVFIAVGAGHLGGNNGVIRLLEKEGYKLTPIKL